MAVWSEILTSSLPSDIRFDPEFYQPEYLAQTDNLRVPFSFGEVREERLHQVFLSLEALRANVIHLLMSLRNRRKTLVS